MNCTGWAANTTTEKWSVVVKHPCYTWTFIEAFWWGLMTITTVGYELNPKELSSISMDLTSFALKLGKMLAVLA